MTFVYPVIDIVVADVVAKRGRLGAVGNVESGAMRGHNVANSCQQFTGLTAKKTHSNGMTYLFRLVTLLLDGSDGAEFFGYRVPLRGYIIIVSVG